MASCRSRLAGVVGRSGSPSNCGTCTGQCGMRHVSHNQLGLMGRAFSLCHQQLRRLQLPHVAGRGVASIAASLVGVPSLHSRPLGSQEKCSKGLPARRLCPLLPGTDESASHNAQTQPLTASSKASPVSTARSKAASHSSCPSRAASSPQSLPQLGGGRKSAGGSLPPCWRRTVETACRRQTRGRLDSTRSGSQVLLLSKSGSN